MPPTNETTPGAINNVWASNAASGAPEYLTLPSGQTCTARRLGIDGLIAAGILTDADSLTALVQDGPIEAGKAKLKGHQKTAKQQAADEEAALLKKLMSDPTALKSIVTMADKAMPEIIVTPLVQLHYINSGQPNQRMLTASERKPGVIYTDQIPFEDKMFLFDWSVGNLQALHAFRDGPSDTVDNVEPESGVSRPAKRASRRKQ